MLYRRFNKQKKGIGKMNMSKTALAEIIKFHEELIAENQRRIDELRGYYEPKPAMFGQALRMSDPKWMLYGNGESDYADVDSDEFLAQGTYFISQEAAELESKKRRLRQLARVRMVESWGDERPDWNNGNQEKWAVFANGDIDDIYITPYLLHFRTLEHAEAFLEEVGAEGIKLIWEL